MKSFVKFYVSTLLLVSSSQVRAGTYEQDIEYFKYALEISRFSDSKLDSFKNPYSGKSNFFLSSQRAPWAGNYYPMPNGGIANRWQSNEKAQSQNLPQKGQLLGMSKSSISKLSAVEKYDIIMGDYEFTATKHELKYRGPERELRPQEWEGFCNGIRAAGILLPEPQRPITIKNPDGIEVELNIADLKALAGASYFYVQKYAQLGSPAVGKKDEQPNPAVFDLALRYFLAEKQKAFIIDTHLGDEIWNESVVGYDRKISNLENLTESEMMNYPNAKNKVRVDLKIKTLGEVEIADSNQKTKADIQSKWVQPISVPASYYLYLDSAGNAIEGKWIEERGLRGVDFAWFGGGQGADSQYTDGMVGNSRLNFKLIKSFFKQASAARTCKNIHTF